MAHPLVPGMEIVSEISAGGPAGGDSGSLSLILTAKRKPVAILSGVTEETLEKTLKTIRRGRALLALEEMQQQSLDRRLDRLTDTDIKMEIRATREA